MSEQRTRIVSTLTWRYVQQLRMALRGTGQDALPLVDSLTLETAEALADDVCEYLKLPHKPAAERLHPWHRRGANRDQAKRPK